MEISEQYRKAVLSNIDEIKKSGKPVIIFGAGRAGWYIMKVLEFYNVLIAGFSANDDFQKTYYNYPVLSPGEVAQQFPDAQIFIGVFIPVTAEKIKEQFIHLNFKEINYDMAAFLFIFFVEVAGRLSDEKILARSIHILFENYKEGPIHYGWTKGGYFVSPFVTGVITQKCTLRCRDCAQLIPYYKSPVNFSVESFIEDLKQYAKVFDVVPEISLHGGEPFIHPQLAEITREVATIPNIVFISFVTNGTLLPSDDKLKQLSSCGADVHQSGGYGRLSTKHDELTEAFRKNDIYAETLYCSSTEMWTQSIPYKKHNRSKELNNEQYKKCISTNTCCQIMNGELHRCSLSMHGSHQNLFPKNENDFIELHKPGRSDEELAAQVREFLTREEAITACDYCDPEGGVLVPPAIQLNTRKSAIEKNIVEEQKV